MRSVQVWASQKKGKVRQLMESEMSNIHELTSIRAKSFLTAMQRYQVFAHWNNNQKKKSYKSHNCKRVTVGISPILPFSQQQLWLLRGLKHTSIFGRRIIGWFKEQQRGRLPIVEKEEEGRRGRKIKDLDTGAEARGIYSLCA